MKSIVPLLIAMLLVVSCGRKTELRPGDGDTIKLIPPAALDTLEIQTRPADSLLRTKRYEPPAPVQVEVVR
jgi:hypothetical protein